MKRRARRWVVVSVNWETGEGTAHYGHRLWCFEQLRNPLMRQRGFKVFVAVEQPRSPRRRKGA